MLVDIIKEEILRKFKKIEINTAIIKSTYTTACVLRIQKVIDMVPLQKSGLKKKPRLAT